MQQRFLLQILLLAQHGLGTTMPIIRSSRLLYRWLLPVVFGSLIFKQAVWCRAVYCVSDAAAFRKPDTQPTALHQTDNLKTTAETSNLQHKRLTIDKHPCPRWDSNPRSQQASDRRPTPQTALLLGPAILLVQCGK